MGQLLFLNSRAGIVGSGILCMMALGLVCRGWQAHQSEHVELGYHSQQQVSA
jgi:hypothetical protein